jgi:hypothetical protein
LDSDLSNETILHYPFDLYSDFSPLITIVSRNWYLLFVICLLLWRLTLVFMLLSLLMTHLYLLILIFRSCLSVSWVKQLPTKMFRYFAKKNLVTFGNEKEVVNGITQEILQKYISLICASLGVLRKNYFLQNIKLNWNKLC